MNCQLFKRSLIVTCFALAACGGGGGGGGTPPPANTPPPEISFSHVFPQGDATATQGVAWDIVGVKTTLSGQFGESIANLYDTLRVDVTFAQDISNALPAPGQFLTSGSQLGISIGFDTDNNVQTGTYSVCNLGSGVNPFEYRSDTGGGQGRLIDGNYAILYGGGPIQSGGSDPASEAVTSISGHILSQRFFLPALRVNDGSTVPAISYNVAVINGLGIETDCVPSALGELHSDHQ